MVRFIRVLEMGAAPLQRPDQMMGKVRVGLPAPASANLVNNVRLLWET